MTILDPGPRRGVIIGPASGASKLFRSREHFKAGFLVGLHWHRGEESFEVRAGQIRFTIGTEQRVCGPETVLFVPAGVRHGFLAETAAILDVFSEQRMGVYVVSIDSAGVEHEEEIFMDGFPSSHLPPEGQSYTSRQRIAELYATTRHLLGPMPSAV